MNNTGNAIMICFFTWIGLENGFQWWNYAAIGVGFLSWLIIDYSGKEKAQRLVEAQTRFYERLPNIIEDAVSRLSKEVRKDDK